MPAGHLLGFLLTASDARAGVILLYHHVDSSTPAITSIKPEQFDRHLEIIESQGFTVVPLAELVENSRTGDPLAREVAMTFDDAYTSIYTEAWPRLKARNWPFTIFVSPAFVGTPGPYYLDWSQLQEMAESGVAIENHTMNHQHLVRRLEGETTDAWRARVMAEIAEATEVLGSKGFKASQFAYPYGEYNQELLDIVESQGLTGFGQQSGAVGPHSDPRLLPRFPLAGIYTGETAFRDKLRSLAMPVLTPAVEPLTREERPVLQLKFAEQLPYIGRLTCYGPGGLMNATSVAQDVIEISPVNVLPVGRSRYNCTLPSGNRFHWFSQLWMRKKADGEWYPEP